VHISKALKTRSKAIQRALITYNQAALTLDPPRAKLTWAQIVEYSTLAEFELLRAGSREDIRNLPWADARNRQATVYHLKLLRAQEEIKRLNIEIKRLGTWLVDEDEELESAIVGCTDDPLLQAALRDFTSERKRVNMNLRVMLGRIHSLEGYSGDFGIGTPVTVHQPVHGDRLDEDSEVYSADEDDDMIDEVYEGMVRLGLD